MKKTFTTTLAVLLFAFSFTSVAQNIPPASDPQSGEYLIPENDAEHPCITTQEYEIIEKRCAENSKLLGFDNSGRRTATVALEWPLQTAGNLSDCSYYHIAAYVDQDTVAGAFHDFNCGTNSYDGHRGTDIATWPFNFYKMDNNLVEVIAAAPGIILDKHDGEFDRNCSSNNLTANYVIIQHGDGSRSMYWHMKNGFVTSVAIGQPVGAGDYLGIVGSSGSASGPHLHFEVWSGSTMATRIDPYSGTCNILNASSWWATQKPAKETGVIRASVHITDIVVPPCPGTETLNESSSFTVPYQGAGLPPGYAKFYIFIRDEVNGLTANLSILNPNATPYLSWTYNSTSDNKVRTWGWSKLLPTIPGTYTFRAVYNGITCSSTFDITNTSGIVAQDPVSASVIYPNPSNGKFTIETGTSNVGEIEIYNLLGETVFQSVITNKNSEINFIASAGVYYYRLKDNNQFISRGKLVIQK